MLDYPSLCDPSHGQTWTKEFSGCWKDKVCLQSNSLNFLKIPLRPRQEKPHPSLSENLTSRVGFLVQPSTATPARVQLRVHALADVGPELRAGGGARKGRLCSKSYPGQREPFLLARDKPDNSTVGGFYSSNTFNFDSGGRGGYSGCWKNEVRLQYVGAQPNEITSAVKF